VGRWDGGTDGGTVGRTVGRWDGGMVERWDWSNTSLACNLKRRSMAKHDTVPPYTNYST